VVSSFVEWRLGLGYLVGYSLGRWCDPDWDLMGTNNAEGRMVNEIPLLGHILYGVSSSYGSIFRRYHRSWITHFPVLSTIVRLVFLLAVPFGYLDAYGINFIGGGWVWLWVGLLAGLSHADGIHWWLDKYHTGGEDE
jgi:hypothetical protein